MFKLQSEDYIYINELQWGSEHVQLLSLSYPLTFLQFPTLLISVLKHILCCMVRPGLLPNIIMGKRLLNDTEWRFWRWIVSEDTYFFNLLEGTEWKTSRQLSSSLIPVLCDGCIEIASFLNVLWAHLHWFLTVVGGLWNLCKPHGKIEIWTLLKVKVLSFLATKHILSLRNWSISCPTTDLLDWQKPPFKQKHFFQKWDFSQPPIISVFTSLCPSVPPYLALP